MIHLAEAGIPLTALKAAAVLASQRYRMFMEDSKTASKVAPKIKKPKKKEAGQHVYSWLHYVINLQLQLCL